MPRSSQQAKTCLGLRLRCAWAQRWECMKIYSDCSQGDSRVLRLSLRVGNPVHVPIPRRGKINSAASTRRHPPKTSVRFVGQHRLTTGARHCGEIAVTWQKRQDLTLGASWCFVEAVKAVEKETRRSAKASSSVTRCLDDEEPLPRP